MAGRILRVKTGWKNREKTCGEEQWERSGREELRGAEEREGKVWENGEIAWWGEHRENGKVNRWQTVGRMGEETDRRMVGGMRG